LALGPCCYCCAEAAPALAFEAAACP
jgi:hypothetical protein